MRLLIQLAAIVVWMFVGRSLAFADATDAQLSENEAYILLDHALDLSDTNNDRSLQLLHYKQWASLHDKLIRNNKLSNTQMKIYLFMVFVAEQQAKIDSLEEISKEIVQVFQKQPTVFLGALKEIPFLVPSACVSMSEHFELYGTEPEKKKFLKENLVVFSEILGEKLSTECIAKFQ